ncbi:MAG: Gfo/Idh/MocA family oxidoreductase [Fusobacteriaceae bacterium]|jgi:predicted dehydrogenase|nr:Gfo/Idh/MocA family oxidoreductase [Fusobacteriaceae bacterium]
MQKSDGMNYAPVFQGTAEKVVGPGEFQFAALGLDHGHIYAMTNGLREAGATLKSVYDHDPVKVAEFLEKYPEAKACESEEEILSDPEIRLVASAIRPDLRAALGLRTLARGKDYFVDKPGVITLAEIESVREQTQKTGRKYMIYFGERIHVEGAVFAEELIKKGTIGRVIHVTVLAPHRLNKPTRPPWFFDKSKHGGIITDIGSHQIEQFLSFAGAKSASVTHSYVTNYANPDKPDFYDYGEGTLLADNGATCIFRVDWFTPPGLSAWGDGRVFIVGTKGSIEVRKYVDVARDSRGDNVYWVDAAGEHFENVTGKTGFVFFGQLIRDCVNRTSSAMTQAHVLEAMRIAIEAEILGERR